MRHHKKIIDIFGKMIASISYRIILIGLSLSIILFRDTFFEKYTYITFALTYAAIYILLIKKLHKHGILRLALDTAYIYSTLHNNCIEPYIAMPYILLPIINSPNHTGKFLFFPTLYITTAVLIYTQIHENSFPWVATCLAAYAALGYIHYITNRTIAANEEIFVVLDKAFIENIPSEKKHTLYSKLLDALKDSPVHKSIQAKNLFCFQIKGDHILFLNSSIPRVNAKIRHEKQLISFFKKYKKIHDIEFEINGNAAPHNITTIVRHGENSYIFVFETSKTPINFLKSLIIYHAFDIILHKLARLQEIDQVIDSKRRELEQEIKQNYEFINSSRMAMHFLRNKFSPIKNTLALISTITDEDHQTNEVARALVATQHKEANRSMQSILSRASLILDNYNKLKFSQLSPYEIDRLDLKLRQSWVELIGNTSFFFSYNDISSDDYILTNYLGLDILLTDILANMAEHSQDYCRVDIANDAERLHIVFSNDLSGSLEDAIRTVEQFMSSDTKAIEARKSHGLYFIKTLLEKMKIHYSVKINRENELYELTLTFEIHRNHVLENR